MSGRKFEATKMDLFMFSRLNIGKGVYSDLYLSSQIASPEWDDYCHHKSRIGEIPSDEEFAKQKLEWVVQMLSEERIFLAPDAKNCVINLHGGIEIKNNDFHWGVILGLKREKAIPAQDLVNQMSKAGYTTIVLAACNPQGYILNPLEKSTLIYPQDYLYLDGRKKKWLEQKPIEKHS